jgi:hypothetical protein
MVDLHEDSDRAAVFAAFGAASPYGHSLWRGRRFLGYFDGGEGRFGWLAKPPAPAPRPRAVHPVRPC